MFTVFVIVGNEKEKNGWILNSGASYHVQFKVSNGSPYQFESVLAESLEIAKYFRDMVFRK